MPRDQVVVEAHLIHVRLQRLDENRDAALRVIARAADDLVDMVVAVARVRLELAALQLILNGLDVCPSDFDGRLPELAMQIDLISELVLVWVNFRKDLMLAVVLPLSELGPQLLGS